MKKILLLVLLLIPSTVTAIDFEWPSVDFVWPKSAIDPDAYHILYFTQGRSCPPCVLWDETQKPKLIKKGILVKKLGEPCNISVVDIHEFPEFTEKYGITSTPSFVLIKSKKQIAKSEGYQTAEFLEKWSDNFQSKTKTKVVIRQSYPLRNNNWTGPIGSRESAINHLLFDGIHRGKFSRNQLEKMTLGELQALHSDDHERRINWQALSN